MSENGAAPGPREGWEADFAQMAARGDDRLLDGDQLGGSTWDDEEWEWEISRADEEDR